MRLPTDHASSPPGKSMTTCNNKMSDSEPELLSFRTQAEAEAADQVSLEHQRRKRIRDEEDMEEDRQMILDQQAQAVQRFTSFREAMKRPSNATNQAGPSKPKEKKITVGDWLILLGQGDIQYCLGKLQRDFVTIEDMIPNKEIYNLSIWNKCKEGLMDVLDHVATPFGAQPRNSSEEEEMEKVYGGYKPISLKAAVDSHDILSRFVSCTISIPMVPAMALLDLFRIVTEHQTSSPTTSLSSPIIKPKAKSGTIATSSMTAHSRAMI